MPPQEYHFAKWTKKVQESEIRRLLKYEVKYYFGGGKPGVLPLDSFVKIIESITHEERQALLQGDDQKVLDHFNYGPTPGLKSLRDLLGERMCKRDGVPYPGDNPGDAVFITTGSQQAIYAALDVMIDPGDVILTPSPVYLGFLGPAIRLGSMIVTVPTDLEGLIPEYLESAILACQKNLKKTPKLLYIVPDSDNPTGITLPLNRRKAIFDLAEKYDFLILEDAPYKEIQFGGHRHPPIKTYDTENTRVLYLCSTSKEAAVFRIGYSMLPLPVHEEFMKSRGYYDLCPTTYTQLIMERYYRDYIDQFLSQNMGHYEKRCKIMCHAIDEFFPIGQRTSPTGGFFVWWKSQKAFDSNKFLASTAIPNQIIFTSGESFYPSEGYSFSLASNKLEKAIVEHNAMRLSFSYTSESITQEGIQRLGRLLSNHLT